MTDKERWRRRSSQPINSPASSCPATRMVSVAGYQVVSVARKARQGKRCECLAVNGSDKIKAATSSVNESKVVEGQSCMKPPRLPT